MNHCGFSVLCSILLLACQQHSFDSHPFGQDHGKSLDSYSRYDIWDKPSSEAFLDKFVRVPRDQVIGFALYTHNEGILKMTAQLFPLKEGEAQEVSLWFLKEGKWVKHSEAPVIYPGWSAHFRIDNWDASLDVPYQVRHGEQATFAGKIRKDPVDKNEIVVASLSCNSNQDRNDRESIVANLKLQDPDLLFFAGDQSYDHKEHTAAWLQWGLQFKDIIRDRPVVTIPDDHDIGQGNLWGENGKKADSPAGDNGGYFYPPEYINMVQRCQTWHLPDPVDPTPVEQGITVYFTRLNVGGIDFAILEDRKFKSGPAGKIPQMGPRPDHINQVGYDPGLVDLPELKLLGDRQLKFLNEWAQDWTGTHMKSVLSQTAFCGAVHLHGSKENRLLADLDCNGWPQNGRNEALKAMRRGLATHLCGDQHLSVVVKHGIEEYRDGPFGFTNPAIVNNYYGRWWWPENEEQGGGEPVSEVLPWTGDYQDGLYNKITMYAYANPDFTGMKAMRDTLKKSSVNLGDGYGLIRFDKENRTVTFEAWPRFADVTKPSEQYPGWPITFNVNENDGRKSVGFLPVLQFETDNPVVQVQHDSSGEILYAYRIKGRYFRPKVYTSGTYTIKAGIDKADLWSYAGAKLSESDTINVKW